MADLPPRRPRRPDSKQMWDESDRRSGPARDRDQERGRQGGADRNRKYLSRSRDRRDRDRHYRSRSRDRERDYDRRRDRDVDRDRGYGRDRRDRGDRNRDRNVEKERNHNDNEPSFSSRGSRGSRGDGRVGGGMSRGNDLLRKVTPLEQAERAMRAQPNVSLNNYRDGGASGDRMRRSASPRAISGDDEAAHDSPHLPTRPKHDNNSNNNSNKDVPAAALHQGPVSFKVGSLDGQGSRGKSIEYDSRRQSPIVGGNCDDLMAEEEEDEDEVEVDDNMAAMQAAMGFGGFGTTKNKKVAGNNTGAVRKEKKSEYRQYMNRIGGFNRPLSPSR